MSSIPTKQIDGDVAVSRHVSAGGDANIQGSARIGHDLIVEGWIEGKNVKSANKGLFATVTALREAYPHPHDGWFAGVSASDKDIADLGLTVQEGKALFRMYVGSGGDWVCEPISKLYEITVDNQQVGNMQEDLDELRRQHENLEKRVDGHDTEISGIKTQQTTLGNSINANTGNITALGKRVDDHDTEIGKNTSAIKAITDSKGQPNGMVPLDGKGLIPTRFIPGAMDDVKEFDRIYEDFNRYVNQEKTSYSSTDDNCSVVYVPKFGTFLLEIHSSDEFYYTDWADAHLFGDASNNGVVPVNDKVYLDTSTNKSYRWGGTAFATIGSDLALGHTENTAFPGNEGLELQQELQETNQDVEKNRNRIGNIGILPFNGTYSKRNGQLPPRSGVFFVSSDSTPSFRSYGETDFYGFSEEDYNNDGAARTDRIFRKGGELYHVVDGELKLIGGSAVGNTFNLTAELPTPDPEKVFYNLTDSEDKYYAPKHVLAEKKSNYGLQITFAIAKGSWKTYQYIGTGLSEEEVLEKDNWLDLAGISSGSEPFVNINKLCGDREYTLSLAVQSLLDLQTTTGIDYRKEGMVITYLRDAGKNMWETKQYQGKLTDMSATNENQWVDFGGGGSGKVETTDKVELDNKNPVTSGGVYEAFQTKPIVSFNDESDADSIRYQGVNEKGDPVGDPITIPRSSGGGETGSTLNIYPETQAVWGAFGGKITLRAAIKSVSFDGEDEILGTIKTISILDTLTKIELWAETVNTPSSTSATDYKFVFDFTDFITSASSKDFTIRATDADGNTKSRTITMTAVDVTCTCIQTLNYSIATALEVNGTTKSLPMYKFENNVSTKQGILVKTEMYYNGAWHELGTATVTDSYSHNISINPGDVFGGGEKLRHGSYPLRIQGTDIASGVEGNTVYTAVMCVEQGNTTPIVSMRYDDRNKGKVRLYDSLSFDVAAYTPGKTTTPVEVVMDGKVITTVNCPVGQPYNVKKQVQGYASDGSKSFDVFAQSGTIKSHTVTLTVEGSAIDASLKEGALFVYDFSTRSNNEPDHTISDGGYTMKVEGSNWNSNGFVPILGENVLRIAENVKAEIPYAPFSSSSLETSGAAIQLAFSTKSIKDKNAMLCECYDPTAGVGFYIRGNEIVLSVLNGTPKQQSVKFKNSEKVTVAVVVEPGSKYVTYKPSGSASGTNYSFVKLYVNGEECAAIGYQPGTSALRQGKTITFNSENGDFNLNYIMAYNSYMEWLQAFRNYLCKLSNVDAMIAEYDKENVLDTTGKPSMSLMAAKGMPYYVIVADQTTFNNFDYALNGGTNTSDQFSCTLYYYNPQHPEVNFKAINVLWRRQGTTSAQRPIKNDRFNFNKKNKATGLKATVTLLNPDESTELGRKAILAAKHNKVFVSETGLFVDVVTVKVDFSDSSNANDCGVCDMMNATFRALGNTYMTPAQRAFDGTQDLGDGELLTGLQMDHSTKNHPIACFRATTDTLQDAWFHAKGNWKEDKGEQVALGFKDTPGYNKGCLNYGDFVEFFGTKDETLAQTEARFKTTEGLDTTKPYLISQYCGRDYAFYRYKEGAWVRSTGSMKQVGGKWVVTGDVLNPVSGYELLQYAGMDWWQGVGSVEEMMKPTTQMSSWVRKLGLAATEYPAWTYYFECMIDDDQLQEDLALGKKVPFDLFNLLRFCDSCDYSKVNGWQKIWKEKAYRYLSLESAMAYTAFTDYLAAVDQRAKNMQPMFFLEDGCSVENGVYSGYKNMEPLRMYLNKIYDCDTCNGADNDGGKDIDAEVDPNKPTDAEGGYTNPYMGSGSVLFNNIDKQPECWNSNDLGVTTISLKSVINRMRNQTAEIAGKTMVPFSPDGALYFFVDSKLKFWPKVISSYDGERKYIDNTGIANLPYFYALHGLGLTSLPRFIEQRWAIRDGYYQTGDFFTNPLSGRVSAISVNSKIYITAGATGYFGIGNDASGQLSETVFLEAGQSHAFTNFAHDAGALLYIYQPGRMSRIDLSEMSLAFHFDDLSKLEMAEEIILGGDKHTANTPLNGFNALGSIVLGDMPFLRMLDVSKTTATSIDAKGCPRVESIVASDTNLTTCDIAQTAPIGMLTLPATMTSLELVNLPKLSYPGGLTLAEGTRISTFMVYGCEKIDVSELLSVVVSQGALKQIRVSGIDVTSHSSKLVQLKALGPVGLAPDGSAYEESGTCSGLIGRWTFTDLADDATFSELTAYFPELDVRNCPFSYITYSDDEGDPENISNDDNRTGFKYSSDDNYVPYEPSVHFARLRDTSPICRCDYSASEGKMIARRLSDQNLNKYHDGTAFDPSDSNGENYDVMKYIPEYWYKGINHFVRSEKLFYLSTNAEMPESTAKELVQMKAGEAIHQANAAIVIAQQQEGASVVISNYANMNVFRVDVSGKRLMRYPGSNGSVIGVAFVDGDGNVVSTFSYGNTKSDFIAGDYLVCSVPSGAEEAYLTVPAGQEDNLIILSDSSDIESIEPVWIKHKAELIGVYRANKDAMGQLRSISNVVVTHGNNKSETNTEWTYDSEGELTSIAAPSSALNMTMKDFCNCAKIRGAGYQLQDYESWKDFSNIVFALLGTRDVQARCGMGLPTNGTDGGISGGYDTLNPNGFSTYPSQGGNPQKGNLVWGLQNYMACGFEWLDYVAVNIESWRLFRRNKYVERAGDPTDYRWHIYDPDSKTERVVQGVGTNSGYCIGKVRFGLYADIVPSQMTSDNSKWNQHYADQYVVYSSKGRVVCRASLSAYAGGGLVYASASYASASSGSYSGSRLAFRGPIEFVDAA